MSPALAIIADNAEVGVSAVRVSGGEFGLRYAGGEAEVANADLQERRRRGRNGRFCVIIFREHTGAPLGRGSSQLLPPLFYG